MTRPLSWMLLAATALGCSNMLGLGDLEFKQEEAAGSGGGDTVDADAPTGSGGDLQVIIPTGGDPSSPDYSVRVGDYDSFPSSWSAGTLFAIEPGEKEHPHYFAYDPAMHLLSYLRVQEGPDKLGQQPWATDIEWTHVLALPSTTGPRLLGYDQVSGIVERVSHFQDDGSFVAVRSAGNHHTHLVVLALPTGNLLFAYDADTGFYRGIPATDEDMLGVMQGQLDAGWTQVVPWTYDAEPALIFNDESSGEFSIYTVSDDLTLSFEVDGQLSDAPSVFAGAGEYRDHVALFLPDQGLAQWYTLSSRELGMGGNAAVFSWSPVGRTSDWYLRRELSWFFCVDLSPEMGCFTFDGRVLDVRFPSDEGDPIVR